MSSLSATDHASAPPTVIQPAWVRVLHWINAVAMVLMIMSGWQIYNASPLFQFTFPASATLGGWLGGALQWHFAAMWLLMLNGVCYLAYGSVSGRFRRKLVPIRPSEVVANVRDALSFRLSHDDITRYNAVQKLLYVGVIAVIIVQVASGWAVWKPMQLSELAAVFGGFQGARLVHFLGMSAIVMFVVIHVTLALLVPRTIGAMLTGGPRVDDAGQDDHPTGVPDASRVSR